MKNKLFYGSSQLSTISYLEFGSIDLASAKKNIWDFRLHDKAYDWLMLARYLNDLVSYIKMNEGIKNNQLNKVFRIYNDELHHQDDASSNLSKFIALVVCAQLNEKKGLSFFELGQTIFGCIEGIEFYQNLLIYLKINKYPVSLKMISWYGVDISDYFNIISRLLHTNYQVVTSPSLKQIFHISDVFFAKGVTLLYAIRSIKDLINTLNKGKIAVFDYSFSLDKVEDTTIGTGKSIRYLDYYAFLGEYRKSKKVMYVKKSNSKIIKDKNRLWLDCVYGEKKLCEQYISLDMSVRKQISQALSSFKNTSRFLNNDVNPEWVPVEKYEIQ